MTKRKERIKAIQQQIDEGLHPMQNSNLSVRKKAALRIADKMIDSVEIKQK